MNHLGAHLGQQLELQGVDDGQEAGAGTRCGSASRTPPTSLNSSQRAARSATARATAERSVPPRPSVVSSPCVPIALEARDDRHEPFGERRAQRSRQHATHLRTEVRGRGADAGLRARERARRDAARLEPEREERRRERLTGGERPIRLAREARVGRLGGLAQPTRPDRAAGRAPRRGSCRSRPRRR